MGVIKSQISMPTLKEGYTSIGFNHIEDPATD